MILVISYNKNECEKTYILECDSKKEFENLIAIKCKSIKEIFPEIQNDEYTVFTLDDWVEKNKVFPISLIIGSKYSSELMELFDWTARWPVVDENLIIEDVLHSQDIPIGFEFADIVDKKICNIGGDNACDVLVKVKQCEKKY